MTPRLATTVQVRSPQGDLVELGPDSTLPKWAYTVIDHPRAWEGGVVPVAPEGEDAEVPAGNAALAEWQAYARAQGMTDAELDGLKRDDLRAKFEK